MARNVTARDGSCRLCGGTNRLSAHHVIPRAENGSDTPENLVTLCVGCPAWVVDKAVRVGVVAVDGTKIAAAATHHATRSYEQSAREILEDAGRIDAAEMSRSGARGDELPERLRTSGDRRKVLREAKQALEAERAAKAKKIRRDRGERLVECRRRLRRDWELERHVVSEHVAWHAAGIASDGSRRMVGARLNIKPYPRCLS